MDFLFTHIVVIYLLCLCFFVFSLFVFLVILCFLIFVRFYYAVVCYTTWCQFIQLCRIIGWKRNYPEIGYPEFCQLIEQENRDPNKALGQGMKITVAIQFAFWVVYASLNYIMLCGAGIIFSWLLQQSFVISRNPKSLVGTRSNSADANFICSILTLQLCYAHGLGHVGELGLRISLLAGGTHA